jgi:signal peptidase
MKIAGWAVATGAFVAWFVLLRPTFLGGSTSYVLVSGTSMLPTLHSGDLVIVHKHQTYAKGDLVAYHVPKGDPAAGDLVIHRILRRLPDGGYLTKGDNNSLPDIWRPTPRDVAGKEWLRVPHAQAVVSSVRRPPVIAALAAILVAALAWRALSRASAKDPPDDEAGAEIGKQKRYAR